MHSRDIVTATKQLMEIYGLSVCDVPDEVFQRAVAQLVSHETPLNLLAEQALRETYITGSGINDAAEDNLLKNYRTLRETVIAAHTYPFQDKRLKFRYECTRHEHAPNHATGLIVTEDGRFISVNAEAPCLPKDLSAELHDMYLASNLQLQAVPTTVPLRVPGWQESVPSWQRRMWVCPTLPYKDALVAHYQGEQRFDLYAAPNQFGNCRVMSRDKRGDTHARFEGWLLFHVKGGAQSQYEKPMHLFYDACIPVSEIKAQVKAFIDSPAFDWYR